MSFANKFCPTPQQIKVRYLDYHHRTYVLEGLNFEGKYFTSKMLPLSKSDSPLKPYSLLKDGERYDAVKQQLTCHYLATSRAVGPFFIQLTHNGTYPFGQTYAS